MDDIHDLADEARHALADGLRAAVKIALGKRVHSEVRVKAINSICRLGQIILAKTLPDLKASHEIHSNTTDLAKVLLPILGPEETQRRLDAIQRNLVVAPKSAAGRPRSVTVKAGGADGRPYQSTPNP